MHKNHVLRCSSRDSPAFIPLDLLCATGSLYPISRITGAKMYGWLAVVHNHDSSLDSAKDTRNLHTDVETGKETVISVFQDTYCTM
jgi:hypothetical protein